MNFRHTVEILTKDIQDIEKLVSNFQNYDKVPAIEMDLVLGRMQKVYEVLLMLKDSGAEEELKTRQDPYSLVMKKEVKAMPVPETDLPVEPHKTEKRIEAPVEKPVEPAATRTSSKQKKEAVVGEKLEQGKSVVHEKISGQVQKEVLSAKIAASPIKSISGSIGINDKFLFIRELFSADAELFRSTMELLDSSPNFNEAYNYLLQNFNWDMDSEVVQQLLTLVRRKFITGGNV